MNEYTIFMSWLFDGNVSSEIPNPEILLKYNSYISHTYLISLFIKCGKINYYFDEYMNNINLRSIDKKELMFFIKECILKNKIKKSQLYYSVRTRRSVLFDKLYKKFPYLKKNDISLLCDNIDKSNEKESIYQTLGIGSLPKVKKTKKIKSKKISLDEFIKNFSIVKVEGT